MTQKRLPLQMARLLLWATMSYFMMGDAMAQTNKTVCGYVEKVTLVEHHLTLSAKLDSGAKTASLHALSIKEVTRHNKTYLSFVVPGPKGQRVRFLAEYAGEVCIKSRVGEQRTKSPVRRAMCRPVVYLQVQLGHKEQRIRVNLTNRKRFNYPLLLGRDALIAFNALIDPSRAFILGKKQPAFPHETS